MQTSGAGEGGGGTRPLWPLEKATSGRTSGVRQGVVCIVAAALRALSAQFCTNVGHQQSSSTGFQV